MSDQKEFNENDDVIKNKALARQDVVNTLENQIFQANYELENIFLPRLGHSEAKRLLLAAMKYPAIDKAFTVAEDGEDMVKAFSCCKATSDALVALGVESTIERMIKVQMEARNGENNG